MPARPPDSEHLLALAITAAKGAGDLLLEGLARARARIGTKSTRTDMVTEIDVASEALIVETLLSSRPDDAIVAEEGSSRSGTSGVRWIIDPLDGTTNYLYGHPGFAVSIAAAVGGRTVAGVVLDPIHGDLFTATIAGGAHRNDVRIGVSTVSEPATALVATGFSYDPERRRQQALALVHLLPRVRDIRRVGAAALDLCAVACGRVDAYFERGLAEWDLAAGSLIASEAGAFVGAIEGGPATPGSVLAAPPALFEPLRALIATSETADPSQR